MTELTNLKGRSTLRGLPRDLARLVIRRLCVHENVIYGRDFRVGRGAVISSPHGLSIGQGVSVGPRSIVQVDGRIGDFALIGMNVQIVGRHDHALREVGKPFVFSTWVAERPQQEGDAVDIGRDVWIGGGATVMGGVTIGTGALVGAASVVTRDLPAYSIAVGSPARVVGERFGRQDQLRHEAALDELSRLRPGK